MGPVDGLSFGRPLRPDDHHLEFACHDEVPPRVGDTEHQRLHPVHDRHQRMAREQDPRGRPRELGEHQAGRGRDEEDPANDFRDHEEVRERGLGRELAVPDRAHRLDAEEEGVEERSGPRIGDSSRPGIERRESQVGEQEGRDDEGQREAPGGPQEPVIDVAGLGARQPDHDRRAPRLVEDPEVVARLAHPRPECLRRRRAANSQRWTPNCCGLLRSCVMRLDFVAVAMTKDLSSWSLAAGVSRSTRGR